MKEEVVLERARSEGWEKVEYQGVWNDYGVWWCLPGIGSSVDLGIPTFLLEKDEQLRRSQGNEWHEIMKELIFPEGVEE
ncbi:MAG: hypothetical protein ACFNYI_07185 [Eubacterium sp.]